MNRIVQTEMEPSNPDRIRCAPEIAARRKWIFGICLWVFCFLVFLESPVVYMADSRYSMLTAESLIRNHTPDLSAFKIPDFDANPPSVQDTHAYQLQRINGRLLYWFPHGTSFLSMPFVALMNALGVSATSADGTFNFHGEVVIQRTLAAVLMATFVVISFWVACMCLSPGSSLLLALGAGFGTQIWSTASREMWSHTWEVMLGILVVHLLLSNAARKSSLRPVWLATLLAWMFFVRPTGAIAAAAVGGYLLLYRRSEFLLFAATGLAWLAAFVAYNLRVSGAILPVYYTHRILDLPEVPTHLYAIALSPSRGLFVFCPVVAVVLGVVARYWRTLHHRPLLVTAVLVPAGIALTCATQGDWGGGWCYGPRYMTDALPWFVLLAAVGFSAIPEKLRSFRSPQIIIASVALCISVTLNGIGALSWSTAEWNRVLAHDPTHSLSWSDPQFLATGSNLKLSN